MTKSSPINSVILATEEVDFSEIKDSNLETYWIYVGKDYLRLIELKKTAPPNYHFIDLGDRLYSISYEIRRPYIDYIGSLSKRYASLSWWVSKIAERNVLNSSEFLYACYLAILTQLINNEFRGKNVCIFSESPSFLETVRRSQLFSGYYFHNYYGNYLLHLLKSYFNVLKHILVFTRESLLIRCHILLSGKRKIKLPFKDGAPLVILRTWVGDNNFGGNGDFNDLYFSDLGKRFEEKNFAVAFLPICFNSLHSFKRLFRGFRESKLNFIIPEEYYHLIDYVKAMFVAIQSMLFFYKERFIFNGHDLSYVFRAEACKIPSPYIIMHYFLMKRIKQCGFKINRLIITFENMHAEKPIIMGAVKYFPETKIVGYFHAPIFPLLLCSYLSDEEAAIMPAPNKIVLSSGDYYASILKKEGYLKEWLAYGPAMRFQHLFKPRSMPNSTRYSNILLVILPLFSSGAYELLLKISESLKEVHFIELWIKPHPMMPGQELQHIIKRLDFAVEYKIVQGRLEDLLPKITILISLGSVAALEAICYGVPVIRVQSDIDLTFDLMDWVPRDKMQCIVRSSEGLIKEIGRIAKFNENELQELKDYGEKIRDKFFSPVTNENISVFLSG